MEKRSFSKEEKLAIIKEASINGVTSVTIVRLIGDQTTLAKPCTNK